MNAPVANLPALAPQYAPWVQLRSGKALDLLDPAPDAISFPDLAKVLGLLPRFGGQTRRFYSVAEHSYRVYFDVADNHPKNARLQLLALLHDAHEAVVGDMTTPVQDALDLLMKAQGKGQGFRKVWSELKYGVDRAIFCAAGLIPRDLTEDAKDEIKGADLRALRYERDEVMIAPPRPWADIVERVAPLPSVGLGPWQTSGYRPKGYKSRDATVLFLNALNPLLEQVRKDNERKKINVRAEWA